MKIDHIYQGNSIDVLKTFPEESIDCVVTSPPYWGLRDYNVDGQLGLEKTPEEYVEKMVWLFREIKRVLKKDGTVWLILGDSYNGRKQGNTETIKNKNIVTDSFKKQYWNVLKQKDLIGIPWRVAFALQSGYSRCGNCGKEMRNDLWPQWNGHKVCLNCYNRVDKNIIIETRKGWYLRQDIIWHKPNPLPESVKDRCTKSHEYIFLLTKSPKYYFDYESIMEIATGYDGRKEINTNGSKKYNVPIIPNQNIQTIAKKGHARWKFKNLEYDGQRPNTIHIKRLNGEEYLSPVRHKRSVWTVPTKGFKDSHFAVYPEELIVPAIKAGCPKGGIVLDPFMGSGTTALVAKKLGRKYIGIELNLEYIKMANRRLSQGFLDI